MVFSLSHNEMEYWVEHHTWAEASSRVLELSVPTFYWLYTKINYIKKNTVIDFLPDEQISSKVLQKHTFGHKIIVSLYNLTK